MNPTAGLGFKPDHFDDALACPAAGLWFEVHAENYMVAGGPRLAMLEALRAAWPLSLHGVALSLAGTDQLDAGHVTALKRLVDRFEPFLVSEHLAWSRFEASYFPDLLPFPRDTEALDRIACNVDRVQTALGRQILIENPSLYLLLDGHDYSETDFLTEIVRRTGCGLLVDVNNVFVSASNLGLSAEDYLDALPEEAIGEIHLAGHAESGGLLIDSHDAPVADEVWALFARLIERIGPRPVLIERDGNVPAFEALMSERNRAVRTMFGCEQATCVA